jgi:hypothetical protein
LLQNSAAKVDQTEEQEHRFLCGKPLREKPRNARRRITIIGRSITIHERTNPLRAINMVELSHLFYDYLALYKGANNSLSWRTRNRVVDVLRLARLTCRSPLGLLSIVQQVNRFWVIFNTMLA